MRDYWRLIRPRIIAMVLFAMAVAAWTTGTQPPPWPALVHALLGTSLVIAGAVSINQRLEICGDARMARTVGRPLPAGRLSDRQVTCFGLLSTAAGLAYLAWQSSACVLLLAVASWVIYVATYTPLKLMTPWQTAVGAAAGAMPVLLGVAVVEAAWSIAAVGLFAIVYFWQLPHAMAIAWLYRREFAAAEVRLATVVEPSGRTAAIVAVLGAAALLPASLVLQWGSPVQWSYLIAATLLGSSYLLCAVRFLRDRSDATARWLLRASLVYLPALLAALLL